MVNTELVEWDKAQYSFYRRLGQFVQFFQMDMPKNNEGSPTKYIDPTVMAQVPEDVQDTDEITEDLLNDAIVEIEYVEGYPTIAGVPFWERLDGEAMHYYKAFMQYREMRKIQGVRSISKLSEEIKISGKILNAIAKVYHWQLRCKAYDRYVEVLKAWEKENAIEQLESSHAEVASKLLKSSMDYLEKHPEQLNPKIAVQMVQLAVKTGRVAAGLPADKPVGCDSVGGRASTNIQINNSPNMETGISQQDTVAKVDEKVKEPEYLQSILHILDKSGAFEAEKEAQMVDAEYTEE